MSAPSPRRSRRDRRRAQPRYVPPPPPPPSTDVTMRQLAPWVITFVVAVLGWAVAGYCGLQAYHAHHLTEHGTLTTAHDAHGWLTVSGKGHTTTKVTAVVDLPDGPERVKLSWPWLSSSDLGDVEYEDWWRSIDSGTYAGTFEVLHDGDGDLVMAPRDVEDGLDESLIDVALVSGAVGLAATVGLGVAITVAVRRDGRESDRQKKAVSAA